MEGFVENKDYRITLPRPWSFVLLSLALAVSIYLRLTAVDHILFWDEADNLLQMHDLALNWDIRAIQLWHPPLYIFLGALLQTALHFREAQMIILSILLGLSTIILTFLLVRRLSGDRIAVLTAFAMAVSPQLNYFGSWVKQDVLLTPLVLMALLSFVSKRWLITGVILALALLTKEPAAIFLLIISIYAIVNKTISIRKIMMMNLIAVGLSIWWYLSYGDYITRLTQMMTGASAESQLWRAPFYEYFRRLPNDMTWIVAAMFLVGIAAIFLRRNRSDILPVLWFSIPYIALMFAAGKSPWFILPVVPAIAWISAIGADAIMAELYKRSNTAIIIFTCLLITAMTYEVMGIGDYETYMGQNRIEMQYSRQTYDTVDNLNTLAYNLSDDRVAMPYKNPILMWLVDLPASQAFDLPSDPTTINRFIRDNKITKIMIWENEASTAEINRILLDMVQNGKLPDPFYDDYMILYETKDLLT